MSTGANARKKQKTTVHKLMNVFQKSGSRRGFFRAGSAGLAACTLGNSTASADDGDPTQLQITGCESDGSISDNWIWINGVLTDVSPPVNLTEGDVISCYDPAGSSTESVIDSFGIECTAPQADPDEPEIIYEDGGDSFEIDLSILDSFEENYDPAAGTPEEPAYTVEDPNGGSIGING
jgi:hypothetical protein